MYLQILLLFVSGLIPIITYYFQKNLIIEIIKDLRVMRILHYVALTGLGIVLNVTKSNLETLINLENCLKFLLFIIALVYAAVFAIISNNFEDLQTDRISNPNRPLVRNAVDKELYWKAGLFCQLFALLLTFLVQKELFYGILFISIGYYLYSCQPFRLKRIPFLAKLIIGFNSLAVAFTGFQLVGGQAQDFPVIWILYILIPLALSANFVDLKDIEGDKVMNVRTLPVMWGEKRAKLFIASMTAISYIIPGLILKIAWLYPIIFMMMALHLWFLYQKPYKEKPIFLIYVSSIFGLNLFLGISTFLYE